MRKLQSRVAILFSASFVALIVAFAWRKLIAMPTQPAIRLGTVIAIYVVWLIWESRIAVRETSRAPTRMDRGTMELYALGRAATVLSALWLPSLTPPGASWFPVAVCIFLGGLILRLTAIRTLGDFYSHRVRITDDHGIVSRGPYRFLRHPAYAGMIVAHVGFLILFFNWIGVATMLFWFLPAIVLRIYVEERALAGIAGYTGYARVRKRLIPLIW
jgi:protein-S-isoprenylcysteine O-methyltransferase Ste14